MRRSRGWLGAGVVLAVVTAAGCTRENASPPPVAGQETSTALDPCSGNGILTPGGIGAVKIGARMRDVATACRTTDTTVSLGEGMKERAHVVTIGASTVLAISTGTPDTSITRVIVRDSSYRTDRGIGIGSTVADLRRVYGRVCATFGERGVVVAVDALPGLAFETGLAPADVPGGVRALEGDASLVPDSARLTGAWATDGPSLCGGS